MRGNSFRERFQKETAHSNRKLLFHRKQHFIVDRGLSHDLKKCLPEGTRFLQDIPESEALSRQQVIQLCHEKHGVLVTCDEEYTSALRIDVKGAWGIIPAHLSELSADSTRGLVPGLAYQMGIVLAARTPVLEYRLRDVVGYKWALAGFEIVTIVGLAITILAGPERLGRSFISTTTVEPAPEPALMR